MGRAAWPGHLSQNLRTPSSKSGEVLTRVQDCAAAVWVNCAEACTNHSAGPQDQAQHPSSTVGPSLLLLQQQRGRGLEQEESTIKTAGLVRVLGLQDPSAAWLRGLQSQGRRKTCVHAAQASTGRCVRNPTG